MRYSVGFFLPFLFFPLLIFVHVGCASYKVVRVSKGVDADGRVVDYYGVTRNNVLIPEYVIDEKGNYPESPEEAERRFEDRKDELEGYIKNKYELPDNFTYQTGRGILGAGLIAVSPVALPITYISSKTSPNPERRDDSFSKVAKEYFSMSMDKPVYQTPELKDELSP